MLLIDLDWRWVKRLSEEYVFTFEAILLYLLRWELVHRWTQLDSEAGREKFEQLVMSTMGDFARIFDEANSTGSRS